MNLEPGDVLHIYYPAGVTLPDGWTVQGWPNAETGVLGMASAIYRNAVPELPATFSQLWLCRQIQSINEVLH